jgi:hypothetical protein
VTVSGPAASAIVAACSRGIQGAGLGPPLGAANSFVTIASDGAVAAALGATPVGSAVAELVAAGGIASHARLAHTRFFPVPGIRSWK